MTDIKARVLYIDDSKEYLQGMVSLLQDDFDVITLSNSLKAKECVLAERPALILLDVHMPFQDGFLTYKKIRELPGVEGRTPIVFISSDEQDETIINCFGLYILKRLATEQGMKVEFSWDKEFFYTKIEL